MRCKDVVALQFVVAMRATLARLAMGSWNHQWHVLAWLQPNALNHMWGK
jgi:hypothetical protein